MSVILRGGPGDLPGSVRLEVHGRALRPDNAVTLALALDWDAIVAELAGHHPFNAARVAAASSPPASPPTLQPLLWPKLPSLTSMEQMHRLEHLRPPCFAVVNQEAAFAMTGHDVHRFAAMPTPVLHVAEPGFAPDLIWAGLHFASARLRNALGLSPDVVEYRDVDISGKTVPARTADYKVLRVVHGADPVDLARCTATSPTARPMAARPPPGCSPSPGRTPRQPG